MCQGPRIYGLAMVRRFAYHSIAIFGFWEAYLIVADGARFYTFTTFETKLAQCDYRVHAPLNDQTSASPLLLPFRCDVQVAAIRQDAATNGRSE